MKKYQYWVYILLCENNTYYTGYTTDLIKRYQSHINSTGKCKYTRSFKPLYIAQCWKIIGDKSFAMKMERHIKKLSRQEKEKMITRPSKLSIDARVKTVTKKLRLSISQ
ncbi:MAG: GIY-YIG nuclease family protein [Gammaproteobacteria bacterium]|nr:GIY-YIG nuclease family protein [Gammaproteobacteria bacterium]MCW5583344.1 GIY-YIG nuclease family protein [Gammaproteobacteria bacterium]